MIKIVSYFIIGILINYIYPINLHLALWISGSLFLLFVVVFYYYNQKITHTILFGIVTYLCVISMGILNSNLHSDKQSSKHYTNTINLKDSVSFVVTFRIREVLKPSKFYDKYIIDIFNIDSKYMIGKSLLNISKKSSQPALKIDDIITSKTSFEQLYKPLNPNQFNYKSYLKKQQIYHQLYLKYSELLIVSTTKNTLFGYASKFRELVQVKLKKYNFKPDEYAIIQALLLGQRQHISKEIYSSYTQAGVIHVLAVSGLHIGIILLILNHLLRPLVLLKNGRIIKLCIIVSFLWCFAIIAGLSASITRAVTMFTILAIAMSFKRPTNIYNTLAISIFILLLFKPSFIFDVGFQLSYMAVIAIIYLQPKLFRLYKPKYKIDSLLWNIITVTLAAQIGIVPITLFYFNQFPGLFILSNVTIIPFLGLILGFGMITIILAVLNILPPFVAKLYALIISALNDFVTWISNQDVFLIQNISFDKNDLIFTYLCFALIIAFTVQKSFKILLILLIFIVSLQLFYLYKQRVFIGQSFLVFHKSKHTLLGFGKNKNLEVHHNLNDSLLLIDQIINDYQTGSNLKKISYHKIDNVYEVNGKTLLVIDSMGIYKHISFKPQLILLRNSPRINITRLIDSLKPELIICDGSNFFSFQQKWETSCKSKNIPFHRTSKKGAYVINY